MPKGKEKSATFRDLSRRFGFSAIDLCKFT